MDISFAPAGSGHFLPMRFTDQKYPSCGSFPRWNRSRDFPVHFHNPGPEGPTRLKVHDQRPMVEIRQAFAILDDQENINALSHQPVQPLKPVPLRPSGKTRVFVPRKKRTPTATRPRIQRLSSPLAPINATAQPCDREQELANLLKLAYAYKGLKAADSKPKTVGPPRRASKRSFSDIWCNTDVADECQSHQSSRKRSRSSFTPSFHQEPAPIPAAVSSPASDDAHEQSVDELLSIADALPNCLPNISIQNVARAVHFK